MSRPRPDPKYLLFGAPEATARGGSRDLIALFDSEADVRAAFHEYRNGHAAEGGWAEAVVVEGAKARPLCWFGTCRQARVEGEGPVPILAWPGRLLRRALIGRGALAARIR